MRRTDRKTRRVGRLIGAASGAVLAAGLLPISPAAAAVSDICPGPGQTDAFVDDEGSVHEDNINCAEAYDIVNGTTATTYEPGGTLTRGQAASILVQFAEVSGGTALGSDGADNFADDNGSVHEANINKAADNGLLEGFSDGTFRPSVTITRAQFATIAVQAVELLLGSALPSDGANDFDDDDGSVHEANIEKAVDNGILAGTGPRTFSPNAPITRGQTATIVIQAAGNVLFPAGAFAPADPGPDNETLTVSPDTAATLALAAEPSTADDRSYTATGLSNTTEYRVTLVDASVLCTTADGLTGFTSDADPSSSTGFSAAVGPDNADLVTVNGAPATFTAANLAAARTTTATPVAGAISFTIDGTDPGTVVPVVYVNGGPGGTADTGGTSPRLEVDATAAGQCSAPIEAFGLGGATTFTAAPAPAPTPPAPAPPAPAPTTAFSGTVASNNPTADTFTINTAAGPVVYAYDANDTFTVDGVPATLAQFEMALSSGDGISGAYSTDPAATSAFRLVSSTPGPTAPPPPPPPPADTTPPTFVSASSTAGSNDIVVTYDEPVDCATVDVGDYTVTRTAGGTAGPFTPTSVTCAGASSTTVTLTFGGAPFGAGNAGRVDKTDGANDVTDVAGNPQADADQVTFTTV